MATVNENFLKLQAGYLFPEIGKRVCAFKEKNPTAKIISMGIGDVTQPLAPAVIKAMKKAALKDREIESRVRLFSYRIPEEFYKLDSDPDALENLIQDPRFSDEIEVMRKRLEAYMAETGDPALEAYSHRENQDEIAQFMQEQRIKSGKR